MGTRSSPTGDTRSGLGRQGDDPRPGGATAGALPPDGRLDSWQALQGRADDDPGAGGEDELRLRQARSTPSMADVRSDTLHDGEGEPR